MRNNYLLFTTIALTMLCGRAWGEVREGLALLSLTYAGQNYQSEVALNFVSPELANQDPLLCTMVKKRIEFLDKIDRKISYLQNLMIAEPKKVTVRQLDELKALENRRSGEYEMLSRPAPELLALWKWQAPAGFIEDFDNGLVQFELRSFLVNWSGAGLYRTPQNLAVSVDPDIIRVVLKPTLNEYCLNPIWLTLSLIKKSR